MSPLPASGKRATDSSHTVIAVESVCAILNLLQRSSHELSLKSISSTTGLSKATAYRYLNTLRVEGYAEQDTQTQLFRVGPSLMRMWPHYLRLLRGRARPYLEALRDELGETLSFGALDGDSVILVDIAESSQWLRIAATPETRLPLHSSGLGKAIAAHLPKDRVHAVLTQTGMPRMTKNTITEIDDYLSELAEVRDLGYAVDEQEHDPDIVCVAVPILGSTPPPTAISVSAPASRLAMRDVAKVAEKLCDAARKIAGEPELA